MMFDRPATIISWLAYQAVLVIHLLQAIQVNFAVV